MPEIPRLRRDPVAFDIGAVEQETGISKDTLRVWERRYGFPAPLRAANGARLYPSDQLGRLRAIRSLLDCGLRAGSIVGLEEQALAALLREKRAAARPSDARSGLPGQLMGLLEQRRHDELEAQLAASVDDLGMQRFLKEIAAPLTVEVGESWAAGRITVRDEHRYTVVLQQVIGASIPPRAATRRRPRVLLTTLPGELHGLGLLMTQAWLAAEGIECICLGIQTPATEIASAALEYQADVVGLSFSRFQTAANANAALGAVRVLLDPSIGIWAGGGMWGRVRKRTRGIEYIVDFGDLATVIDAWE